VYAPYPPDSDTQPFRVQPGATVLFYDAAGTLIDRRVTGPDGVATGMGAPGGTVTAMPPSGVTGAWYTWVDVAPDDHLYTQAAYSGPPYSGSRSVIVPRDGDADIYLASSVGFGGVNQEPPATGDVTVTGQVATDAPAHGDLVAGAVHPGGSTRFIVAHDVKLAGPTVDLSTATWSDPVTLTGAVDHFPEDTRAITGQYLMLGGGRPLWSDSAIAEGTTTLAYQLESPGTVGDGTALSLWFQRNIGNEKQFWYATFNGVDPAIDLAPLVPPDAASVRVQPGNMVTWQVNGDRARAAGAWLAMDTGPGGRSWLVMLPADQQTFSPLQLPADIAPFPAVVEARVQFVATNEPARYAGVRTDPSAFDPEAYGQSLPPAPGTYRIGGR
jgi:hypothetical protein